MGFKIYTDSFGDQPLLICDVCDEKIIDVWGDMASGSKGSGATLGNVKIHHAKCSAAGAVHMPIVEFLRLFCVKNHVGDLGSNGLTEKVTMEYPMGKGFEA